MPRFIVLGNFTEQGIKTAKDSPKRAAQAREAWRAKGVELEAVYWTLGSLDLVAIVSAKDGLDVASVLLELGAAGNVRTQTLRALDEAEFNQVLSKLG
jgi:uncharacterized protein with GYD domain